jgi:hypothetical protein
MPFTAAVTLRLFNDYQLFSIQTNKQTNKQTNYMEQSPSWEANRSLASQDISRTLCNRKVHNRIHKSPAPVFILGGIDPFKSAQSRFSKIHFNITRPS